METLYGEISDVLERLEKKSVSGVGYELLDTCDVHNHIAELKDIIRKERSEYHVSKLKTVSGVHV